MSAETESYARTFAPIIDDLVAVLTGLDDGALALRDGGLRAEGAA